MCTSRLHRVLGTPRDGLIRVVDLDGRLQVASLLAWEGEYPAAGDWVVVHCGYALSGVDPDEARAALDDLAAARRDSAVTDEAFDGGWP